MGGAEKPYRVYRGGRTRGKVPTLPRPGQAMSRDGRRAGRPVLPTRRRRLGWGRGIVLGLIVLLFLFVLWGVASYLAVSTGVSAANTRLDAETRAALVPQEGLLVTTPTTILMLGTDHSSTIEDRRGARRADSIVLVRTDPRRGRLAFLSIPRDLRVDVTGHGPGKINSAMQLGGTALAVRTVRRMTGLPVNHVAVVDFGSFAGLIDAIGGITLDVPRPIVSNRFDCPYATAAQCRRWPGWRFAKGKQELDGRRALVYSRIRENRLDPSETDLTRGERQQAVMQAIMGELTSAGTLIRLPFVGDELLQPLATDLTTWEFVQLGWRRFRASPERTLHCRLGGTASSIGGESFIVGSEENVSTVAMFTGVSAPQPPLPGSGPFGPGCIVGSARGG